MISSINQVFKRYSLMILVSQSSKSSNKNCSTARTFEEWRQWFAQIILFRVQENQKESSWRKKRFHLHRQTPSMSSLTSLIFCVRSLFRSKKVIFMRCLFLNWSQNTKSRSTLIFIHNKKCQSLQIVLKNQIMMIFENWNRMLHWWNWKLCLKEIIFRISLLKVWRRT